MNKNSKKPAHASSIDAQLYWLQLAIEIPNQALQETEQALNELGALSLSLRDAANQPLLEPAPGELPLWDRLTVEALFDSEWPLKELLKQVQQQLPRLAANQIKSRTIPNQAWERVWMDRFQPMSFGNRLWIYPSHIKPSSRESINIRLDPGLAFGTGTHATTALCLQWLDKQELANKTVLDYGCGSGVLSIAACKLGAKKAYAVDIDPQALQATESNAKLNRVNKRVSTCLPKHLPTIQADIVLANIISNILIGLKRTLVHLTKNDGALIMSGILPEQCDSVRAAYTDEFEFYAEQQLQDWCLLESKKR